MRRITVPERIRLAASQRPTIPLRVKRIRERSPDLGDRRLITMDALKSYIAVLCVALLALPTGSFAAEQQTGAAERQTGTAERQTPAPGQQPMTEEHGIVAKVTGPYRASQVPTNNLTNSSRLESL